MMCTMIKTQKKRSHSIGSKRKALWGMSGFTEQALLRSIYHGPGLVLSALQIVAHVIIVTYSMETISLLISYTGTGLLSDQETYYPRSHSWEMAWLYSTLVSFWSLGA